MISLNKKKVFCIGQNKTGTTSLEKVLVIHGFSMGNQVKGEYLLANYLQRDFKAIRKFCKSADAFQDVPFSLPYLYVYLDQEFPGSKFILTIRNNSEQWYNSITKFHAKITSSKRNTPSWEELGNFEYRYKGWIQEYFSIYNTPPIAPYQKEKLISFYNTFNEQVIDYFKNKKNLLIINVAEDTAYLKLTEFLNVQPLLETFPWENKLSSL